MPLYVPYITELKEDLSPQLGGDLDLNGFDILNMIIGTDIQAYSAILAALAGVSSASNKLPYFTGASTMGLFDVVNPTTFTPNFTNVTNVASFGTQSDGFYFRFEDFILFFGRLSIDPTSGSTDTEFTMDPIVSSDFTLFTDVGGVFACLEAVSIVGGIRAQTTSNKITFKYFNTSQTAAKEFSYIGGMRVK